jgi:hypothetical protein
MNSRRWMIVVAFEAVLHNALRVAASILGAPWGVFNYLRPFHVRALSGEVIAQLAGVAAVLIFAAAFAGIVWRKVPGGSAVWSSSLWAAASGAFLGLLAAYVSTLADKSYGIALFIAVPFLVGFVAVSVIGMAQPVSIGQAAIYTTSAVALLGFLLIGFAMEGAVCLVMALPVAVPVAICGGLFARLLQRKPAAHHPATFLLLIGLTPFGATLEHSLQPPARLFTVTTSLDIPASPDRVWRTVLQPTKLAAPSHPLFRAGIAYPLASHIEGTGLTATRYCDFSTGKLVEPVLIWKEGSQLRFTVVSNPLPMQEWTPYAQIHPPHLEGFLASRQGEFRLERLTNGGTRLFATTWYQHHMWPASYWRAWSDYTIHRVHDMVLKNISERAEGYK